ncbi:MAG: hypothetical protein ACI9X4_000419 [Glaciecola sp.]|jgi:hypothetical protein
MKRNSRPNREPFFKHTNRQEGSHAEKTTFRISSIGI